MPLVHASLRRALWGYKGHRVIGRLCVVPYQGTLGAIASAEVTQKFFHVLEEGGREGGGGREDEGEEEGSTSMGYVLDWNLHK